VFSHHDVYTMPTPHPASASVRRALRKLGADLAEARKRRRLTMSVVADRAFTSRPTLQRIEAGDAGVGIGIYAAVLQALGLLDGLADLAAPAKDTVGQALAAAALPRRIRPKRSRPPHE
jgi:transcriptional regulator with XRE-family HTH domain